MVSFWGWAKDTVDTVGNIAKDAVDTVGNVAKDAVDTVGNVTQGVVDTVGNVVSDTTNNVVRVVENEVIKPLDVVVRDAGNAIDDLKNKAAGLVGLGKKPNSIPPGPARRDDAPRKVILGWHPVAGVGGQVFEKMVLPLDGIAAVANLAKVPNPTHHWAVLVGDYIHELNADASLDVVYQNYKFAASELWFQKEVGTTRFNDEALRLAGEQAISKMAGGYNILNNNCQKFALGMLDLVLEGQRERFMTSYATSAITPMAEVKIRPAVQVFATEETAKDSMAAATAKEKADAKAAGDYPGVVMCMLFPTMEEAEAARKADEAEKAVKAEEAAKVAAKAAAEAAEQVQSVTVNEITLAGELAPDSGHVEQVDLAKQLMDEQTPGLTA